MIHPYGRTYERRPLHYLVISSPDNLARIEDIRQNNLRLADPSGLTMEEAEQLKTTQPAIVWLSYNIHGNEPSSTEAAMQVAYRLAAGIDQETVSFLDQLVIIMDPCLNPDGRDRYAYWYRSMRSEMLNQNASDVEHAEPWPGGRTNHYWFDLNRDWVWLVHPESQGRIAAYQQWLPQVHVDYHEQGFNSNYFTMPGTTPRNLNLPDEYDHWADVFGRANAEAFDAFRISYFTRESFDFMYPGYGSSYPSNMGGIGMLTEQGGGGRGARAVETEDGYVLTLRQRIFDHYTTSLATVQTSAHQREALLDYFQRFFSQDTNEREEAAYLIPDDHGKGYAYLVVDMLLKHGIHIRYTGEPVTVRNTHNYWDGTAANRTFDDGVFVIPTDQPRHIFVNTIFQRQMAIEDSVMYDMASWAAPLAYNLDAAWTTTAPTFDTTPIVEAPKPFSGVINAGAQYAYVIDWNQQNAPKALAKLWDAGYKVRAARKPFCDGAIQFTRGSLVVLLGRNPDKLASASDDMLRIASEAGIQIVGMDTGRMEEGIDLSSNDSRFIGKPKVALLVDSPFSSYTAGQIWFLFDQWTEFGISRIRIGDVPGLALDEYDVVVMPGAGSALSRAIDSVQVTRLRDWVQRGGTLVATEGSALFLTEDASKLTDVKRVKDDTGEQEVDDQTNPAFYTSYEAREDSTGLRRKAPITSYSERPAG